MQRETDAATVGIRVVLCVHLAWWSAELNLDSRIVPNPQEVESVHWFTPEELATAPNQLESNQRFAEALARGEISLE